MAQKRHAVIRAGYVISVVVWDRGNRPDWAYPRPHDAVIEELTENVGPGDFYDEAEGVFYRPLSKPPDLPEELGDLWPPAPQDMAQTILRVKEAGVREAEIRIHSDHA